MRRFAIWNINILRWTKGESKQKDFLLNNETNTYLHYKVSFCINWSLYNLQVWHFFVPCFIVNINVYLILLTYSCHRHNISIERSPRQKWINSFLQFILFKDDFTRYNNSMLPDLCHQVTLPLILGIFHDYSLHYMMFLYKKNRQTH